MNQPPESPPQSAYDQVAEEIGRGEYKHGLQARAVAECEGNEARSRARYIQLRALEIWGTQVRAEEQQNNRAAEGQRGEGAAKNKWQPGEAMRLFFWILVIICIWGAIIGVLNR